MDSSASRSILSLAVRAAALAVFAMAAVFGVILSIPDENDLMDGMADKFERLDTLQGEKIVLVGGSNLLFGMNSRALDEAFEHHVVNMAVNAYVGFRFMAAEVRGQLNPGDVVLISLENNAYFTGGAFDPVEGKGIDLLVALRARPASWVGIRSPVRWRDIMASAPLVAQLKVMRVVNESIRSVAGREEDEELPLLFRVENRAGLDEYGDLVSHLDEEWPSEKRAPDDLGPRELDDDLFEMLRAFHEEMAERGVQVFVLPPPTSESDLMRQGGKIRSIWSRLQRDVPDAAVARAEDFVFADSLFWDNYNHLWTAGRDARTSAVIELLASSTSLGESAR